VSANAGGGEVGKNKEAVDATILALAQAVVPTSRISSIVTRDAYTCVVVVDTDAEKRAFNSNATLLAEMKAAAVSVLHCPIFVTAEAQETVDRRWKGDWNHVFR
jgi:hypothetical protein